MDYYKASRGYVGAIIMIITAEQTVTKQSVDQVQSKLTTGNLTNGYTWTHHLNNTVLGAEPLQ